MLSDLGAMGAGEPAPGYGICRRLYGLISRMTVCMCTMRVRRSGTAEQALRESHTHGTPEMNLRRRKFDPAAPEGCESSQVACPHTVHPLSLCLSLHLSRCQLTGRRLVHACDTCACGNIFPQSATPTTPRKRPAIGNARSEPPRTQLMFVLASLCACLSRAETSL